MASFTYTGRNSSGGSVKGVLEAPNSAVAAEQLFKQNITPIAITEAKKAKY